ncbi:hypothetical protein GCM10029992_47720 [Glycomyces albus]
MTSAMQTLVRAAARNNAEWCAAMARTHGTASQFGPQAWTAPARTPQFYPDAVTLVPRADVPTLVDRIDTAAPGASVKDSFADLDLTGHGFDVLFESQWIHRPAGPPRPRLNSRGVRCAIRKRCANGRWPGPAAAPPPKSSSPPC